jgi:hypothetical protein
MQKILKLFETGTIYKRKISYCIVSHARHEVAPKFMIGLDFSINFSII